jgi:hypothetical protein
MANMVLVARKESCYMKKIPNTLNDAINKLYSNLTEKDIKFIKENNHSSIHHFGGMQMRNDWNLWDKEAGINKDVQQRFGLSHGDDVSGLIFSGLWEKVKGNDVDKALQTVADKYKKHWQKSGVDAMTGEPLPNHKNQKSMIFKVDKDGEIEIL